jgi:very-short-patch-repair endonuclease
LLRRNRLGLHFRRQHAVGAARDARRTDWLGEQGIRVLRFTVDEVEQGSARVIAAIAQAAAPSTG